MNPETPASARERLSTLVGFFLLLCQSLALSVEVFLHRSRSFGERYINIQAGVAVLIILFYPVFWPEYDARPLLVFLLAFVVMCTLARIASALRRDRPESGHTLYSGYPRLMRFLGRAGEVNIKRGIEPIIVFFAGAFTLAVNQPLGSYLMLAAFGLAVSVTHSLAYQHARVLDLNDTIEDQRVIAEQFREMRRD